MAIKSLQVAAAELKLKDLVSKKLKKIGTVFTKTVKKFKETTKEGKKTEKQMNRLSRAFDKVAKSSKKIRKGRFGQVARGAGRGAVRGATGGGVSGAFAGIPFIGGLIAGIFAAMNLTKNRFASGIILQKELKKLSTNFSTTFGKNAKKTLKLAGKFFRVEDIKTAALQLTDFGVDALDVKKAIPNIVKFAKAQGFTNLDEAIGALTTGRIKAGRGLDITQIKQLQALAPLTKDVATAQLAFEQISIILDEASKSTEKFSKITEKSIGGLQRTSNTIQNIEQETIRRGADIKGGLRVFRAADKSLRLGQDAAAIIAATSADLVKSSVETVKDITSGRVTVGELASDALHTATGGVLGTKIKKKAGGGPITPGQLTLVGERGPELFIPGQAGSIANNQKSRQIMGSSMMNNTINIYVTGSSENIANDIALKVKEVLSNLARNELRMHTGLDLRG